MCISDGVLGKWIWISDKPKENEYAVFKENFAYSGENLVLDIAAVNDYIAQINGKIVSFGQFQGYKNEKYYDTIKISKYCKPGKNELKITVRYEGINTLRSIRDTAGVIFDVKSEKGVVISSSENTLGAKSTSYVQNTKRFITMQIGYSSDMCCPSDERYEKCVEVDMKNCKLLPRPVKKCNLLTPIKGENINKKKSLYDFGAETVGYLHVSFKCKNKCVVTVAYGEHIADGEVRRKIESRDFSLKFHCQKGENDFTQLFVRIGARYVQLIADSLLDEAEVEIIPAVYPVTERKTALTDIDKKIYDVCIKTLKSCMHEHYEDCPWREQALYAMDSLNQAVCGYYCFGEYEFAAASLRMLGRGMQPDGFLELHTPGKEIVTIPYFTFMWAIGVRDYLRYSGDRALIRELWPSIRLTAQRRLSECQNGLLPVPTDTKYWSFYEWNDLMSGEPIYRDAPLAPRIDAPYQMFFLLFLDAAIELAEELGESEDAAILRRGCVEARRACHAMFWDTKSGSYCTFAHEKDGAFHAEDGARSELVQALAVLSGTAGQAERERLLPALAAGENDWTPCTLSMIRFKYEALLAQPERYLDWVFADIARIWGKMLYAGATSFWETEDGADAFDQAGSLCHGWSAMPVYFYYAYGLGVRPAKPGFAQLADSARRMDGCSGSVPTPEGMIHVETKAK